MLHLEAHSGWQTGITARASCHCETSVRQPWTPPALHRPRASRAVVLRDFNRSKRVHSTVAVCTLWPRGRSGRGHGGRPTVEGVVRSGCGCLAGLALARGERVSGPMTRAALTSANHALDALDFADEDCVHRPDQALARWRRLVAVSRSRTRAQSRPRPEGAPASLLPAPSVARARARRARHRGEPEDRS